MERSESDFFKMPPLKIDLSQAHSLRMTAPSIYEGDAQMDRAENAGNSQVLQFRQALQEVIGGLTKATQTALESQHHYFETVIKEFMETVQNALNDIDGRLNLLSQAQAQTEDVLDAFLKIWMLGGKKEMNLDDQVAIVNKFLTRGLPVVEDAGATLTAIAQTPAREVDDQATAASPEA